MVYRPLASAILLILLCMSTFPEVSISLTPVPQEETDHTALMLPNRLSPNGPYNVDGAKSRMDRAVLDDGRSRSSEKSIYWRNMEDIRWTELWPFKSQFPWLDPHNNTYPEYMLMDELRLEGVRNMSGFRRESPEPKPLSPSPNDWIVMGEEAHENEVIILTGNLIIQAGGNLTLVNCTLYVNCTYDGEWQIRVESGGIMNVLKGSNITAYNPNYEFLFYVYGRLVMRNSELHECGYYSSGFYTHGPWLETDEGVIIENCTLSNCYNGMIACYASNITISNCKIAQNHEIGIDLEACSNVLITNCKIFQNGLSGVRCYSGLNIMITNCTISSCGISGISCSGLNITIYDCDIFQNGVNSGGAGIDCWDSVDITISACRINFNDYGIYCSGLKIVIVGCEISYNRISGIYGSGSNIMITNCIMIKDDYGIRISALNTTISNCEITRTNCGILCSDCLNITISNCGIIQSGIHGIHVISNSSGITIMGCEVIRGGYCGIGCSESSDIVIIDCKINFNNHTGVSCSRSLNVTLSGCMIIQNEYGIDCFNSSSIMITNCAIIHNYRCGIELRVASNITILNCLIIYNGWRGIWSSSSSNVSIHYCNIFSNRRHGLYVCGEHVINATYNWWGASDGPEYKGKGEVTDPEEIYSCNGSEYLLYEPWLTEPNPRLHIPFDNTPPNVEIIAPTNGSQVCNTTIIRVKVTDNIAVERIEFYINNNLIYTDWWQVATMRGPYECTWDTTKWPNGPCIIKVVAYDISGNTNSTSIVVIVNNVVKAGKSGLSILFNYGTLTFTIACVIIVVLITILRRRKHYEKLPTWVLKYQI